VASGDGSDQTGRQQRQPNRPRTPNQPSSQQPRAYDPMWDIDPAEIDRYLSGRPTREQEAGAQQSRTARSGQPQRTAEQLNRLRQAVSNPSRETPPPSRQQPPRAPQASGSQRPPQGTPQRTAVGRSQFAAPVAGEPPRTEDTAPSPRRQQARPQAAGRTPDVGLDDELYTDDPYIDPEYEDDWAERPARRAAMPKPQIRLSKPNLPRPVMPAALANAPLANDTPSLSIIGIGLLGLALMAFTLSSRLESVADPVATHVSASGVLEHLAGKDALWRIPLMATMLMVMNIVAAWFFSTIDQFAARFILAAGLLVQFIAWVALIQYLW